MKKLLLLSVVLVGVLVSGCSKDDGFNPAKFNHNANLLYGEWETDSYFDGRTVVMRNKDISLSFDKSGVFKGSGHLYLPSMGRYKFDGNYIILEDCTISVVNLSSSEMYIHWWYGSDSTTGMCSATFTKSN